MRVASFSFRPSDKGKLQLFLKRTADKYAHVRALAVYGMCCGRSSIAVAEQLQVSQQAVYKWVRLYCASHDAKALLSPQRTGRPRAYDPISGARILKALQRDPRNLGYPCVAWTVSALAHYLNACYRTAVSEHTLRRRMKELGLRYKRPKYVYEEKEPNMAQKKGRLSES